MGGGGYTFAWQFSLLTNQKQLSNNFWVNLFQLVQGDIQQL